MFVCRASTTSALIAGVDVLEGMQLPLCDSSAQAYSLDCC